MRHRFGDESRHIFDEAHAELCQGGWNGLRISWKSDGTVVMPQVKNTRGIPRSLGDAPSFNANVTNHAMREYVFRQMCIYGIDWSSMMDASLPKHLWASRECILYARTSVLKSKVKCSFNQCLMALVLVSRCSINGTSIFEGLQMDDAYYTEAEMNIIDYSNLAYRHEEPNFTQLPKVAVFVENPYAMLRVRPYMLTYDMRVVDYCKYGMLWKKPTCLWVFNASNWKPRPRCNKDCYSCLSNGGIHSYRLGRDQSHSRNDTYCIPRQLMTEVVLSVPFRECTQPWALELCCGRNKSASQPCRERGWQYVGIDFNYADCKLLVDHASGMHTINMDLTKTSLKPLLCTVHALTGLLPQSLMFIWFSPPCTTFCRPEYANKCYRRDHHGTPWEDARGDMARAHDNMIETFMAGFAAEF